MNDSMAENECQEKNEGRRDVGKAAGAGWLSLAWRLVDRSNSRVGWLVLEDWDRIGRMERGKSRMEEKGRGRLF